VVSCATRPLPTFGFRVVLDDVGKLVHHQDRGFLARVEAGSTLVDRRRPVFARSNSQAGIILRDVTGNGLQSLTASKTSTSVFPIGQAY